MSIQVSIQSIDATGPDVVVKGKLIPSGNYVGSGFNGGAGGDVVDFTKAVLDPLLQGVADRIPSSKAPYQFVVWSQGGVLGQSYGSQIGSGQNNCKFVLGSTTFNTEQSSGAYPAAVLADNIGFEAVFPKFQ